jgi:hypothetical protein
MTKNDTVTLAFYRFAPLIGKWELRGRTLDSDEDNITGWNTFEWILDGMFLKSEGEITFKGSTFQSIELIAYNAETQTFPSHVYSSMSGEVLDYKWDVQGSTVIHSGLGATYSGTLSADGNTLTGGWRPDEGTPATDRAAYDAVMVRVK